MASSDQSVLREGPHNGAAHYRYLVSRHSWFLLLATPLTMAAALLVARFAVPQNDPDLTARSLIGIENREDMAAGQGIAKENLGREDLMLGRTFIREVVRTLSLQLMTGDKRRAVFFDSAAVDSTVPSGLYRVRINRRTGNFSIVYFDTNTFRIPGLGVMPFVKGQTLIRGAQLPAGPVSVSGGMTLLFSKRFLANPRSFDFSVMSVRLAVENVLRALTIKRADLEHGINYITVQMTGKDYELLAATANEIARTFVEKNLSFSKRRSQSILAALEKQLALANNGQGSTSNALSSFQSENPLAGSSSQVGQSAANLAQIESSLTSSRQTLSEAEGLIAAFSAARGEEKARLAAAMLEIMSQNNLASARPLRDALQQLITEERAYAENYDERHPLRIENARKIGAAAGEAASLFDSFTASLRVSVAAQTASKNAISWELNRLPTQEVQLGRLQRKQQVIGDVYSAVLERYNKAKVADAVEIADFYIMDAAVPPLPPPLDRSKSFLIALLIGLALPAAALVIRSRATGAVYTKTALNDTFGLPVLEAVPKFSVRHNGAKKTAVPRIDAGCKPAFIPELFDSMLMKLRLRWAENPDAKVVAITGLETGSGKSTIALNLAIRIAELGNTVLLVDTDLHRGKIHDQFDFPLSPGLTDALKAQEESLIGGPLAPINATGIPSLSVVPAGEEIENPFNALSLRRFEGFVREWRKRFSFIILDAAPIGVIPDAAAISDMVDSYIIVVNAGSTNIRALQSRLDEFTQVKAKVTGFVLNRADTNEALLYHRSYSRYHRKNLG